MATKSTTSKKARAKGGTTAVRRTRRTTAKKTTAKKTTKKAAKKASATKKARATQPKPRTRKVAAQVPAPRVPRRVIFIDVENTSSEASLVDVVEHLQIDRVAQATEMIAVGNWKSVGARVARRLAALGSRLVHSAPSPGVRDWSDLAIAVAAGQWLATAEAGDVLEIVSDDRAFDAVGDAAASAGIVYRRISHRTLASAPAAEPTSAKRPRRRGRRGRGGTKQATSQATKEKASAEATTAKKPSRRRGRRGRGGSKRAQPEGVAGAEADKKAASAVSAEEEAHTASHDQIISILRRLSAAKGSTNLDALANALRDEGFTRPPGSPRLVVRLRRIKDVDVSPGGVVRLVTHEEKPTEQGESVD